MLIWPRNDKKNGEAIMPRRSCADPGRDLRRRRGVDADLVARAAVVLELHDAVDEGVDRVVRAEADVAARVPLRAALAHDDVARDDLLAAVLLDAAVLRIGIAAVARGADALFMCHRRPRSAEGNVVDLDFGEALPMPALARVVLSALLLEDDDLVAAAVTNDLTRHLGALERRHAGLDRVAVVAEEHLVELDRAASFAFEARDLV